jgi:predicted neuraminidase
LNTIVRELPNKEWIAVFQSGGNTEPHPDNEVFLSRSRDQGASWEAPCQLFDIPNRATYATEISVVNDKIYLFVAVHSGGFLDMESFYCLSEDCGYTWGELIPLPHRPQYTFVWSLYVKDNGEWMLPFNHYKLPSAEYERLKADKLQIFKTKEATYEIGVLSSQDQGVTWKCSSLTVENSYGRWLWPENNVVEFRDGSMAMLMRMDGAGVLYRSDSTDGGRTWCLPYRTDIPNPGAKIRMLKLRDGRIVLIHNPSSKLGFANRNPLSVWISEDEMKSWSSKRDIVTFPGWHSYPDGFVDEKQEYLHVSFDYNRHDAIYVGVKL